MDRWNRWMKTGLYDEVDDPSDPGGEGTEEEMEESEDPSPPPSNEPPTPTEGQSPFSDPRLEGLSEAEIAERLAVSESTIRAQRKRMDELETLATRAQPQPQEDDDLEDRNPQKFFEDPYGEMSKVIEKQLKSAVAPLVGDLKSRRVQGIYENLSQEYPNFDQYRSAVQEQIRLWNIPDEAINEDLVRTTFLSKVGEASLSRRDNGQNRETETRETPKQDQPPLSPQHRPSSHPPRQEDKTKKRKLTEEERKFARIQFRGSDDPYAEYLKWADAETNEDGAFVLDDEEDS